MLTGQIEPGSAKNILPVHFLKSLGIEDEVLPYDSSRLLTYSDEMIPIRGKVLLTCSSFDGDEKQELMLECY